MIIFGQNKNGIVNFENIPIIEICKNYNESLKKDDESYDICAYMTSGKPIIIGKYKTEERAKEILNDIGNWYCRSDIDKPVPVELSIPHILTRLYSRYNMPEN